MTYNRDPKGRAMISVSRKCFIQSATATGVAMAFSSHAAGRRADAAATGVFAGMRGAFSAMYTPYTKDNKINFEMIDRIVEYGLRKGLAGFYVTGSTGESMYLTVEERAAVVARTVKAVRGRGKVIAHVGYASTDDAVRCAKLAADAGADWVSSVAPGFLAFGVDAVVNHYRLIAEATNLPLLVYSWNQELNTERELRLFDIPNVCGMKYTGNDFYSVQKLKRRIGKEAVFYVGNDPMLLPGLAYGSVFSGGIGLTYNYLPRHHAEICRLAFANDFAAAAKWQDEANWMLDDFSMPDYSLRKAIMRYIGLDCGPCRHPFMPPTEAQYRELCEKLDRLGICKRNEALEV